MKNILCIVATLAVGYVGADLSTHLVHQWTFNDGTAADLVGSANGTLYGKAWIGNGALYIGDDTPGSTSPYNYMITAPIGTELKEKTLVAWCALGNRYMHNNCAGAVLSITDGNAGQSYFDAIVYGERVPHQWMNGSDYWTRTPEDNGGKLEQTEAPTPVMIAISYHLNPYRVCIYRNGELYVEHTYAISTIGRTLQPTLSANSVVTIGPRNAFAGYWCGFIDEARIYDTALSAEEIAALAKEGPVPSPVTTPWNGSFETNSPWTQMNEQKTSIDSQHCTIAGWFMDSNHYDFTAAEMFMKVVNTYWCCDPTDGFAQMWLEVPQISSSWGSDVYPAFSSGPLGTIKAGDRYRVQADFTSGPNANNLQINDPVVELVDLKCGDVIAQWQTIIPTAYTRTSCDFMSPVMDASREGHQVCIRFSLPLFLNHAFGQTQHNFGVDNVRLSVESVEIPTSDASAVWTQITDGMVSDSANWQSGKVPSETLEQLTFKARTGDGPQVAHVRVDQMLWVSNLVVEAEGKHFTRVIEETTNGRFTLWSGDGVPEVSIGTGLTRIRQLSAPKGLIKKGEGTLQVGGFRNIGGTLDIQEGCVSVADELAHRWSFNDGTGRDTVGFADGTVTAPATIEGGVLNVPGAGSFITEALGQTLSNETLLVWTSLNDPTISTKGSALSIVTKPDLFCGFEGIVYGELNSQCWMAGSENWNRTQNPQLYGTPETSTDEVMISLSHWHNSNCSETFIARNGVAYVGKTTKEVDGKQVEEDINSYFFSYNYIDFSPSSFVMIGPRHYGNNDIYNGTINEARIYRYNMTMASLASICEAGPNRGVTHLGRSSALPQTLKVNLGGESAVLDLNMTAQTIGTLSGEGAVRDGTLTVKDKLAANGVITFDSDFAISENCNLEFTANGGLKVQGALTLPAKATLVISTDCHLPKKAVVFEAEENIDWSVLDNWDFEMPKVSSYLIKKEITDTAFAITYEQQGLTILLR